MASDTIFNDLWEIAQRNSSEEIDEKSFKKDLSNSIYAELEKFSEEQSNINDEFSRTLPLILAKAEVNPQILGEAKGGSFKVSSEIVVMAVKTIKYENQFIIGTSEYEKRHSNEPINNEIKEIILTAAIIDKMIDTYPELTYNEKDSLIENYSNMTEEQQQAMLKNVKSGLKDLEQHSRENGNEEEAQRYSDVRDIVEDIENIKKMLSSKDVKVQEKARKILEENKKFKKFLSEKGLSINSPTSIILEEYNSFTSETVKNTAKVEALGKHIEKVREAMDKLKNSKISLEEMRQILGENSNLLADFLKHNSLKIEDLTIDDMDSYIKFASEKGNSITQELINNAKKVELNNQLKNSYSRYGGEHIASSIAADFGFTITEHEPTTIDEPKGSVIAENRIEKSDNKQIEMTNTIAEYTEYFQNLDDDDLKYLFEEVEKDDFFDTLNQELSSIEDKETLNIMINATYSARELLKNPQNREDFFSKMGKIVEEMNRRGNTQLIKDEEMQEIFKQAGIELQVGEFEQVREEDVRQEINSSNQLPIEEIDARKEFLENHENFEIDSVWEEICRDAQDKGQVLEGKTLKELYKKYKNEIELSEGVKTNAPEDRGEKAGNEEEQGKPELLAAEEVKIAQNPQEVSLEENQEDNSIEHFGKKGKNERVAVIEKDEEGNITSIQVFRPIPFLRVSNLKFEEFENAVKETSAIAMQMQTEEAKKDKKSLQAQQNQTGKKDDFNKADLPEDEQEITV